MSEDSISYGEDKENLLYISKKINVDDFGLSEEGPFRESVASTTSELSVKPIGSELNILEGIQEPPQIFEDLHVARKFKPFSLKWSFGMNSNIGLINLTNGSRKELFFSSAHSAILYKYCTREMKHLEGHQALINCISSDSSGDWLMSCDGDKDGCLIIWSSSDLNPVFTLFSQYPESGILLAQISPCARYLITIGEFCGYYSVDFWLWTIENEKPSGTFQVSPSNGLPVKICFHPDLEEHIMLIFEKQVFFIIWDSDNKKLVSCPIPHLTNKNKFGKLTGGTYMKECHECYAASSRGCILVFRNTLYSRGYEDGELNNSKMFINSVKVTPTSIGVLTTTEGILVVGDARGHIFFFDKNIKILYWIRQTLNVGAITAISFSLSPKQYFQQNSKILITVKDLENDSLGCDDLFEDREEEITKLIDSPFDATLQNKSFTVNDFFFCTVDCNIYFFDFIRNTCNSLFQIADANVSAMDAHDEKPRLVIGYENGRLSLIDFEKKEQISEYLLPKTSEVASELDAITCIKFSYESLHLICGRANGEIWFLEPVILKPKSSVPINYSRTKIIKIDFCHNGLQFAYYDDHRTVMLFNYNTENACWEFCGKVRAHYNAINDMQFFCKNDCDSSILYTIGKDRYLVEYNNIEMRNQDDDDEKQFGILSRERIEQSAIPLNFTYYEKQIAEKKVGYILFANDQHKIRTIHAPSKLPRSLVLGPAFGCFKDTLVKKMRVLPHRSRYMLFICEKYLGILILPADGNPYKNTGYLAHPTQIADFVVSYNGLYAFTYGVQDRSILQWEIKNRAVELLSLIGGTEIEPYYDLLEGGKNGWLFQEIQDLFFYMQILQQENIDLPRRVSDSLSLTEIPHLVRTCGFYLSHFELEILMIDIRYREFDESGIVKDEVSFVEFVKLFINHRPAYGYTLDRIKDSFKTVCLMSEYPRKSRIENNDFVYLMQTIGEPSTNFHKYLTTLLRIDGTYSEDNYDFLPNDIDLNFLNYELLGIDDTEHREQQEETHDSVSNIMPYFY